MTEHSWSRAEIAREVTERVARAVGVPADAVDTDEPFGMYGLTSVAAARIAADLAEVLGRPVRPTALFDHPTVGRLADALSGAADERSMVPDGRPGGVEAEPVAIVGVACRLPGASTPDDFWRLVLDGGDAVGTVPPERWRTTQDQPPHIRQGGFLGGVDQFDAEFFRMSPEEAARTDPQHRLLLETVWEAVEDAGTAADTLGGSHTGVYVGISTNEYARRQLDGGARRSAITPVATALSIAANRVSYAFDFHGPSMAVDTACSSSLVALHLAVQSIRRGECDRAVVAGVNLLLDPDVSVSLALAGMLSPDGRCRTFDAGANGYVRGEGCVALVLRPLRAARSAGERVYACVLGSAVNQDGASNGLTAPNGQAQRQVVAAALGDAGVRPRTVAYVECHGTGTALGDPVETGALAAVLGADRGPDEVCALGSVKANVGHLEAAAGVAGVLKTALALHHGVIPPTAQVERLNPALDLESAHLVVNREPLPWPGPEHRAGVSGFGFGGTNAHVVLGPAPAAPPDGTNGDPAKTVPAETVTVVPVSARTRESLERLGAAWAERIGAAADGAEIAGLARLAAVGRVHHPQRVAAVGAGGAQLADDLGRRLRRPRPRPVSGPAAVAFVVPGQDAWFPGLARDLLTAHPVFASTVRRCSEITEAECGLSVVDVLAAGPDADAPGTDVVQPTLVAVQLGLAAVWEYHGVLPRHLIGHSIGEVTALCVGGALTLEQALRLACVRGRAMADPATAGRMLATDLDPDTARRLAAAHGVDVAAVNGPGSTVLAGTAAATEAVADRLRAEGGTVRWLPGGYAFHSRLVEDASRQVEAATDGWDTAVPELAVYSTVTGRRLDTAPDGRYWRRNVRDTVRFADAVGGALTDGASVLLELGSGTLTGALRRIAAAERGEDDVVVSGLRRGTPDDHALAAALADLYERGVDPRWDRLHPARPVVSGPTYAWQRQRYWYDWPSPSSGTSPGKQPADHPLLSVTAEPTAAGVRIWEVQVGLSSHPFLADHRVRGAAVFPASGFVELLVAAAQGAGVTGPLDLHDVRFPAFLGLDEAGATLQVTAVPQADGVAVTVHGRRSAEEPWTLHASARCAAAPGPGGPQVSVAAAQARCLEQVPGPMLYAALADVGLDYGPTFRVLREAWRSDGEALGALRDTAPDGFVCHPALLDGAFQAASAALGLATAGFGEPGGGDGNSGAVPVGIGTVRWNAPLQGALRVHVAVRAEASSGGGGLVVDCAVLDGESQPLVSVSGLRLRRLGAASGGQRAADAPAWLFVPQWREDPTLGGDPVGDSSAGDGRCLVFHDDSPAAGAATAALIAAGRSVTVARHAGEYRVGDDGDVAFAWSDVEQHEQLMRDHGAPYRQPFEDVIFVHGARSHQGPSAAVAQTFRFATLVRALSMAGGTVPPRLWLVTAGAHRVGPSPGGDPWARALWGLSASLVFENPALQCRAVDLDPADLTTAAGALVAEMGAAGAENAVALVGGRRYVRRLAPVTLPVDRLRLDPDAAYVVTGGTGALGLASAEWLVRRGARTVALLARTPPGRRAATVVERLRGEGADVRVVAADVADARALGAALDVVRAAGHPIRGILHCAGVLRDGPLVGLRESDLVAVTGPKAAGADHLLRMTADDPLDWTVYFSSAASVLGSPGQAAYCAGNAMLDAVAGQEDQERRRYVSISWGPWARDGMAATAEWTTRTGFSAFDPDTAVEVLDAVLSAPHSHVVALPFDLRDLLQYYPVGLGLRFYDDIYAAEVRNLRSLAGSARPMARPELAHAYVAPRNRVERYIASLWQTAIGIDRVGVFDGFFELGGDSVFANQVIMEVNREFGIALDAEKAFEDFTVARLAVLAEDAVADLIASMSDDEAERLVAELRTDGGV